MNLLRSPSPARTGVDRTGLVDRAGPVTRPRLVLPRLDFRSRLLLHSRLLLRSGLVLRGSAMVLRPTLVLLALLLSVGACGPLGVDPFEYNTVEVTAADDAGEPIEGVHLILYSGSRHHGYGITDADGHHLFRFVPSGALGVSAQSATGFDPRYTYTTFRLGEGEHRFVHFTFAVCSGDISAEVLDDEGAPVAGVELILYSPAGILATVQSGADGTYHFQRYPCGEGYAVKVQPPEGYRVEEGPGTTYFDGIPLGADDAIHLTFILSRL